MKLKVEVEVTEEQISNLLTTAVEGGIGYWAVITDYNGVPSDPEDPRYLCILNGGSMQIEDTTGEGDFEPVWVDREMLEKGLAIMAEKYPRHFADFVNENDDACTGDVFFQCAALGEVIFG